MSFSQRSTIFSNSYIEDEAKQKFPSIFQPRIFGKELTDNTMNEQNIENNIKNNFGMSSKANLVFDKFIREPRNRRPCTATNLSKMDEEKFSQKKKESFLLEKIEMEIEVEGRGGCPQQVLVYVGEIFEHLRVVETKFMADPRYMHVIQKDINEKMRAILLDWLVDVHLKFKLLPETLFLTVNIIDRYLQRISIPRQKLQLVGITAMLIACKYEEIYVPEINDFVYVTDKAYTNAEVLDMEGNILSALEFNLTTVSPLRFLERYAMICNFDERCLKMANYLLEISLIEYKMICYPPSMLACSAIYLVNKLIRKTSNWNIQMIKNTKYNENNLNLCSKDIFHLLQNGERSNLQAVRRKFSSPKFLEVVKIMEKK